MTARRCAPRPHSADMPAPRRPPAPCTAPEPPQRLHNMSAPPRATISFRPLARRDTDGAECAAGLRWFCRIDVPAVFWPLPDGVARDIAERVIWNQTLEPQRRMLAAALAEEAGATEPDAGLVARVEAMTVEAMMDALGELARRIDPLEFGLPEFGLLRPARGTAPHGLTRHMRLALAVLARRRGHIFLRAAGPMPPGHVTQPLDLWTTEPRAVSRTTFSDGLSLSLAPQVVPAPNEDTQGQAAAGTRFLHTASRWIPAFAGMTTEEREVVATGHACERKPQ